MRSWPTLRDPHGESVGSAPGQPSVPVAGLLDNPVRCYDWGSRTVIAELLGHQSPSESPEAELWMGAHPAAPSYLVDSASTAGTADFSSTVDSAGTAGTARRKSLIDLVAADPETILGAEAVAAFGPRFPFLLKLLAVGHPLSLQVHPDPEQARRGFTDEQVRGISLGDPARRYGDDGHKPELVVAVSPFVALSGLRDPLITARLLDRLGVESLTPYIEPLRTATNGETIRQLLRDLFSLPPAQRTSLVTAVATAVGKLRDDPEFGTEYSWGAQLAAAYPGDVGVVVSLLLNLVVLSPGEGLHTPAGRIHAYLSGTAVEVMASSNNVLRAGLTSKFIDVDELLTVMDPTPGPVRILHSRPGTARGESSYMTPDAEYQLSVIRPPAEGTRITGGLPQILFCLDSTASISIAVSSTSANSTSVNQTLTVPRGGSVFLAASVPEAIISSNGTVIRATTGTNQLFQG